MSFIEGIGDEVTAFFVLIIVLVIATLVTFIGNGSQFVTNSQPVITVRSAEIIPVNTEWRSQRASETQIQNTEPPDNNRTSPPYPTTNQWPPQTADRYYQEAPLLETNIEDVADDTEDQNSSDDARPSEELRESEIPTAPAEENQQETAEQSTPSGVRIRLKYLDDTERNVKSNLSATVGEFKRNHFPEELASNKIVRLIFCGHLLRDNSTLESYRIVENSVIHVQILQAQANQNRSPVTQNAELDLSNLLWPLLSIILGMCWIFYFKYPEFFSLISIGILLVFTGSLAFVYSAMRQ
ncbi:ubiquitin-like domain-containing protein [Caerostris extrusa]|uniref:Ubiquitin-like domain-containing protein n=1 Tax=Caerostris extrusa TaxID=172846 RepID=A0AAV4RY64_CAEEX|nr:ubiquitin-like domain-containing protein [Caerostris extrusa]